MTILEVENLRKHYAQRRGLSAFLGKGAGRIAAVDDVSFFIRARETLGLVGETGCGKTTVGKLVLKLIAPTSGRILFEGEDITPLSPSAFQPYRKAMQMIFQDLDAALNPKMRVEAILRETISVHHGSGKEAAAARIAELLDMVNLKKSKLSSFPGELSGGEKRRVGLALALAVGARFIVADEPTSALDVSIQAQVVNLLRDLQERLGLSYLFISHDLRLVELLSHKVAVMYLGKIVETGVAGRIARSPRHPYSRILWSSLTAGRTAESLRTGGGGRGWGGADFDRPSAGCRFAPRCPVYEEAGRPSICTDPASEPELREVAEAHRVRCHFPL